jgi:hypothetical protein
MVTGRRRHRMHDWIHACGNYNSSVHSTSWEMPVATGDRDLFRIPGSDGRLRTIPSTFLRSLPCLPVRPVEHGGSCFHLRGLLSFARRRLSGNFLLVEVSYLKVQSTWDARIAMGHVPTVQRRDNDNELAANPQTPFQMPLATPPKYPRDYSCTAT